MIHIIYIPGLGDRYDFIRRLGLLLWRRKNIVVTLVPMRWADHAETHEQKLARIEQAILKYPDANTVLVGESAGGAMAVAALHALGDRVSRVFTLCGMNQGVGDVNPNLYRKNVAFRNTMQAADAAGGLLSSVGKKKLYILYSSRDFVVRPKNTLLEDVESLDLKTAGHMTTILYVLYARSSVIRQLLQ